MGVTRRPADAKPGKLVADKGGSGAGGSAGAGSGSAAAAGERGAQSAVRSFFAGVRGSFSHTPRTLRLVWRASPRGTVILAVLTLVAAVLPLGVAWVGKAIIDAVVAGNRRAALDWVLVELALIGGQALVQRTLGLVRQLLGARLAVDINVLILEKALTLELRHFEDPAFYDQLTRARREASSRPVSVVVETFQLVQNGLTLAGYVFLLIAFSPWAVLGLALSAVPATVAEMRFSTAAFRLRNWRAPESRKLMYIEYVLANDNHAKEVKLFGIGPTLLERYRTLGDRFYREDRVVAVKRAFWAWALSLLATGAFYACYAVMAVLAATGRLTLGNLTLYIVAFRQGQQAFQSILTALGGMYEDNLYMSNLFQFLAIPSGDVAAERQLPAREQRALDALTVGRTDRVEHAEREPTNGEARAVVEAPGDGRGMVLEGERGIRLDGVGFRYPGAESWALRNIDLFIPAGQSVALVGHNGAGKTTLIKLLTRLYRPTEGRILLDGKDLQEWDPEVLRARFAVVFQDFNQYQFTVRENVGFGSIAHVDETERVERAVDRGGAAELTRGLPDGLETQLGRWFIKGHELSGGQWQKVALARAFMREEADILILDEPTAALDAESEHAVFERFRALTRGRTTFLISHRFPTVRMADRILVISGGRIEEQGSHEELLAAGGRYAKLFGLQAQGYL